MIPERNTGRTTLIALLIARAKCQKRSLATLRTPRPGLPSVLGLVRVRVNLSSITRCVALSLRLHFTYSTS